MLHIDVYVSQLMQFITDVSFFIVHCKLIINKSAYDDLKLKCELKIKAS